jgi:hypothetical protein
MEEKIIKSKEEILKDIQDIAKKSQGIKDVIESMLLELDDLEKKYYDLISEIKK